jgi:hypothetical protein
MRELHNGNLRREYLGTQCCMQNGWGMQVICKLALATLLVAALAGCGSRIVKPDDNGRPAYRLDDGSLCEAPADFAQLVDAPATTQVRSLFLASASPGDIVASIVELPPLANVQAAFYLSCEQYARRELSKKEFNRRLRIYQELRVAHVTLGIREWRDDPEGYAQSGKLCHFIYQHGEPDSRDVTRLVPPLTSVDDCAIMVNRDGGTHVLLGCSNGRWDTYWAEAPLLASPNGWANRRRSAVGTRYVPEPNCGWY